MGNNCVFEFRFDNLGGREETGGGVDGAFGVVELKLRGLHEKKNRKK